MPTSKGAANPGPSNAQPGSGLMSGITPDQSRLNQDQARLDADKASGSGIDQFSQHHHIIGPILRGLSIAGSALFPTIGAAIPGTDLHHQLQLKGDQENISDDQAGLYKQAQIAEQGAKATKEQADAKKALAAAENGTGDPDKPIHTYIGRGRAESHHLPEIRQHHI